MKEATYRMSFTAGGLLVRELSTVAEIFIKKADWQSVEKQVTTTNHLQARTVASSTRIFREVKHRLAVLDQKEIRLLVTGDLEEKKAVAWLSVCRVYKIIRDFALEVINDRFQSYRRDIHFEDFDFLLNRKASFYPELDSLKDSTRLKLRQVTFKMLREVGIISESNKINTLILSDRLLAMVRKKDITELQLFPCLQQLSAGSMHE
ncbi:MAG TPA: DUF1819 domain-containing protein [Candidatus Riflebacteria bacterium]|nr:DUF1819 domain-containing protein [Candidatus Riflebacteria bacterium]